jgi:hypothetical protein
LPTGAYLDEKFEILVVKDIVNKPIQKELYE